jgi:endonuclease G
MSTIGHNKVAVPTRFYKILLDVRQPELKALAFIIPNRDCTEPLSSFVVSINEVENQTGLDFFPALPDDWEEKLESMNTSEGWAMDEVIRRKAVYDGSKKNARVSSVQCNGLTKAGNRCKRMTKDSSGRCSSHQ